MLLYVLQRSKVKYPLRKRQRSFSCAPGRASGAPKIKGGLGMKKFLALTIVTMLALACIPASALDLLSGADTYPLNSDKTITWYAESNLNPHEKYADWTESPFHTGPERDARREHRVDHSHRGFHRAASSPTRCLPIPPTCRTS